MMITYRVLQVRTFVDQNVKISQLRDILDSLCAELENAGLELKTQMSEVMDHLKASDKE